MKSCVFLIGTNGSGKTSIAKQLIQLMGGVTQSNKWITRVQNKSYCFAGKYNDTSKYGGVDGWGAVRPLPGVVEEALKDHDCIICEGVKLHSNGPYLCNALFKAERQMVFLLYAPPQVLHDRLIKRSGNGVTKEILKDQQACARSLSKWALYGVLTQCIDTSKHSVEECAKIILNKIQK